MLTKKKNRLTKFSVIAVILLLIFLHFLGIINPLEKIVFDVFGTSQARLFDFFTRVKYSFVNYREAVDLKKENIILKEKINQLTYKNSQLQSHQLENEKLRELLNFKEKNSYSIISADVIGKDPNKINTLIINRGERDGIKSGQPVIVNDGIIIGKIIETKEDFSAILLVTDKQSQIAVSTPRISKTIGLAQGEYGLSIKAQYIPQDAEIGVGDLLITSGSEENLPRGLVIGEINRIDKKENEIFKAATIRLPVDYDQVTAVGILHMQEYK